MRYVPLCFLSARSGVNEKLPSDGCRQPNRSKIRCRIEVVFSRFIDHAQVTGRPGFAVGEDLIELPKIEIDVDATLEAKPNKYGGLMLLQPLSRDNA